jgi:hypothetical protein
MGGLPKKVVNGVLFDIFLISSVVYFLMHLKWLKRPTAPVIPPSICKIE